MEIAVNPDLYSYKRQLGNQPPDFGSTGANLIPKQDVGVIPA
jgi:hypothetical protein